MCVRACATVVCLSDFMYELSDLGNERVQMEVCESVNGFTVKGEHQKIHHNDEMR